MKITVDIPDALLREAKRYAVRHNLSLREVFECGLRATLSEELSGAQPFRLKTITTKGEGLICDPHWSVVRSIVYEGHGG